MGLATYTWFIGGVQVPSPREWQKVDIDVTFDNESVQANIETDVFTWVNEAAVIINKHVEDGKIGGVGIFEAPSVGVCANDGSNAAEVFDGFLDMDTYEKISPVEVRCAIMKTNGMNSLVERLEATTYGHLREIGLFPDNKFVSIPYVVEKDLNVLEILMMSVTIYQMTKEIIDSIKRIVEGITYIVKAATPDFAPLPIGAVGQIVSAILLIVIDILITILLIIAIINLLKQFLEAFVSFPRTHKATRERVLLETMVKHLGYGFASDIEELDQLVYLPTPEGEDTPIQIGLPRAGDFGYFGSQMFDLMHRKYWTKLAIIDNVVHLRPINDPFWRKNSTYVLLDVDQDGARKYNTQDLSSVRLIEFETDTSDIHTIENFRGTVFQTTTLPIQIINQQRVLLKRIDHVQIPVAHGNRKSKFTDRENALKLLAQFIDGLVNSFGGNASFAKQIRLRIGQLKLSETFHRVPKTFPFINGQIPENARDIFSAKTIDVKFHSEKSFVKNNFRRQRRVIEDQRIGLGFSDFLKLIKNSYFVTKDGDDGKMISFKFKFAADTALVTYEIDEVYTKNLKERTFEE